MSYVIKNGVVTSGSKIIGEFVDSPDFGRLSPPTCS